MPKRRGRTSTTRPSKPPTTRPIRSRRRPSTQPVKRTPTKEWWREPEEQVRGRPKERGKRPEERPAGQPWPGLEMAAPTPWGQAMLPSILKEVSPTGPEAEEEERPRWQQLGEQALEMAVRTSPIGPMVEQLRQLPGTRERFQQDVRRAWEQVGKPAEAYQLPGTWGQVQELMRRPRAEGTVTPEMPGAEMWQPMLTQEQAQQATEELGAAVTGLPRAAWHDIKQLPVVGTPFEILGSTGGTALAALNVPTTALKETVAQQQQRLPGGMGIVPFAPTPHLSEQQREEAATIAERTGMPEWMAQQGVLLTARQGQPSIRQYAQQTYGTGEQTEAALSRLGAGMGYSSYEAQRNAIDRLMGGEQMDVVTGGRAVNTYEPTPEDKAAVQSYVENVRRTQGDDAARAALVQVQETGQIPGESDIWNEVVFEYGLDPLNMWDLGAFGRVRRAREALATGRFTEAVEDVARVTEDVAAGVRRGLGRRAARGDETAGAVQRLWDRINPLAQTAQSQADDLAGVAYQVVSPAVMQVENADEARAVVRAMVEDPGAMTRALGNVPVSQAAEEMRPVLQTVLEQDLDGFKSLKRGTFSRAEFLNELDAAVALRAAEATGAAAQAEKGLSWYQKRAQGFKSLMSEFHLRTPGYAARNAMGDMATMAWDGVMSFDGRRAIDNFLERLGPTTRRVSEARQAGSQMEAGVRTGSRLGENIFGRASAKIGQVISAQEEGRYLRAFYTELKRQVGRMWRPELPEGLRAAVGEDAARAIERGMTNAVNDAERAQVVERALGDGGQRLVDLGQFVRDPDVLSVGMRLELEQRLGAGEVVDDVIDDMVRRVREQHAQSFATDPIPPGRRWSTDAEALQDLQEEQGWLEALGQRMGVGADETAAAADELAQALAPGERAIREGTGALAAQVAQGMGQGADVRQGSTFMRQVRARVARVKRDARAASDQLRAAAWEETRRLQEQGKSATQVWVQYRNENNALRLAEQQEVLGTLDEATRNWDRLAAGEEWMDVVGRPMEQVIDESLDVLRSDLAAAQARKEKWARLGLAEFADFDARLDAHRLGVDLAEQEAWRLLAINPSRDGMDIVMSTQEAVDSAARAAVHEVETSRIAMQMGKRSPAAHRELADEVWGRWFKDAAHRFDLARAELSELPLNVEGQRQALRNLGWPDEAAQALRPEQVQGVLGAGVRWDPMLDAPTMPLEEALRGTLGDVSAAAGVDLTRAADWTAAEWDAVEAAARALGRDATDRATTAGRLGRAALEMGAEAAEGAPRTVAAGMEIVWPQSVDDVARVAGMRPQQMTPEQWEMVAQFAENRGQQARLMGDEFGRRSLAAQEAQRLVQEGEEVFGRQVRRGRMSFAEEQARIAELGGEARQVAEQNVNWVLGQAGFGETELEGLTWSQRQRLVEEMGQGELLRTASGRVSQIDAINEGRRAEMLERSRALDLGGAAYGIGVEPENAAAYRWLEMAEQARDRARGGGVMNPPGQYDLAGFPVVRQAGPPPIVSQRGRVERAMGMVPEAEQIGRGGASVGFEARQAQLATRYEDIAEMAKARAALQRSGRHLGEAVVVPEGVTAVRYRKQAGHYVLELTDEAGRTVGDYWFDNYGAMRAARNEAEEVIRAGQQGQQAATVASADAWGSADVMRANRRAVANGYMNGPTLADAARVQMDEELEALENIRFGMGLEQGVAGAGGVVADVGAGTTPLPPMARRQLTEWAQSLGAQWNETRAVAVDMARQGADEALLNYGKRRRVDEWLAMAFPYSYWKTRSARNWLIRAAQRPAAVAGVARLQEAQEQANIERGYRGRFEGGVEVPVPGMPEWTGGSVFVNPLQMLVPWAQIMGPEWTGDPAEAQNLLDAAYMTSQRLGLRPYGFLEWPLKYAGWIGEGREDIGYVLPHTGAVQAATALAGVGPPGGVSLEGGVRRMFHLPEQEPYGAYRVQREISNMAADIMTDAMKRDPSVVQQGMVAQELQRLVVAGDLDLQAAMGWGDASQRPVERVAEQQGWSPEQLAAGQEMLQEAVRRAAAERGIGTLSSFLTGVPLRVYPSGERQQVELEQERRGRMYSPLTGLGSRAELEAFREEHPEAQLRTFARTGLPGVATEEETYTPGEAWQREEYGRRSGEIEQTYELAIQESLKREPWNRDAVRDLEEEMRAELDVLRDEVYGAAPEGEEPEAYRVRSVYGASPAEEQQIRREEILAAVSAAMPKTAQFAGDDGTVDYDAYEQAVADFFATLPERMAGDERLGAIAGAMAEEVGPVDRGRAGRTLAGLRAPIREERIPTVQELLEGITRETVSQYWTRNDTPLEALQRVYEETVYSQAWDDYNQAVDGGMDKGDAYEQYIEGARGRNAGELIGAVMEAYPDRWTEEELRQAYEGVEFPDVAEVSLLRKPEEEQALARGQSAFWDFLNEGLPPGKMASGARDYNLVQLVLDAETRGTVTAEQYEQALAWLETWKAENQTDEWLGPEEWAEARRLNDELSGMLEQYLPGIQDTLSAYYDLPQTRRSAFKKEHPEIDEYYDARDWFGAQEGNELWAYFYLGKGMGGGAAADTRAYTAGGYAGRHYYRRTYTRRRYGGGGRGGGGGAAEPDWKFAYQARDVPRAYLKDVSPWDTALRFERYYAKGLPRWDQYKAEGVPWLMGKWQRSR